MVTLRNHPRKRCWSCSGARARWQRGLFDPEAGGPLDTTADDIELLLAAQ
jgi:hypothetical protein